MKRTILVISLLLACSSYAAKVKPVMVDEAGVVVRPANFAEANGFGSDTNAVPAGSVVVYSSGGSSAVAASLEDAWIDAVAGDIITVHGGVHQIGALPDAYRSDITLRGIGYPRLVATNDVGRSNYALFNFSRTKRFKLSGFHFDGTVIGGAAHDYTYNFSAWGCSDSIIEDCIFQMDIQPTCTGMIQIRNWISHAGGVYTGSNTQIIDWLDGGTFNGSNNVMRNCSFVTLDRGTSCLAEHLATHNETEWTFENCRFIGSAFAISSGTGHQGKFIACAHDRDHELEYDYFGRLSRFAARAYMIPETGGLLDSAGFSDEEAAPIDLNGLTAGGVAESDVQAMIYESELPEVSIVDASGNFTEYLSLSLATAAIQNGDTLTINGGSHTASFPSSMTNVTIMGINDPIITEALSANGAQGFSLSYGSGVTIRGINFDVITTATGGNVTYGMVVSGSSDTLIEDCHIQMRVESSGNTGAIGFSTQITGTNNVMRNCSVCTLNNGGENNTPTHLFIFAPSEWYFENVNFVGDANLTWTSGLQATYARCRSNNTFEEGNEYFGRIGPAESEQHLVGDALMGGGTFYAEAAAQVGTASYLDEEDVVTVGTNSFSVFEPDGGHDWNFDPDNTSTQEMADVLATLIYALQELD